MYKYIKFRIQPYYFVIFYQNKYVQMKRQIVLMDKARIERSLKRMAIELWERLTPEQELVIVGLNERGFSTAKVLFEYLKPFHTESAVELIQYDVKNLTHNKPLPECSEKFVLIIDDVIFSGKTMFDAVSAIISAGEPERIEVLTLLDRGHRKYPIKSNITGMTIPTKVGEHVEVMLSKEKPEQVVLFKNT
jgi:pyrimidine operon attenuation protein/uracil phosphoribosyltransferase